MKINILGTEYDYDTVLTESDIRLRDCDGYADLYAKTIRIATDYSENNPDAIKDFEALIKKVKRHEIIHATFFESGLTEWANNECLVDWVAVQFPKMLTAFKEVGAL